MRSPRSQATFILVFSILVGAGTYLYLIGYQAQLRSANELLPVLVARSEIASGTSYAEMTAQSLYEVRELPRSALPADVLTPERAIDAGLKSRGVLSAGQLLTSSFFTTNIRPEPGLPIPKGMLAVTISVDEVSRVGNFVLPGSRVVVFTTSGTSTGNSQTRVLLPDVLVIGIGNQTDVSLSSTTPLPSPLVTVALPPKDAQALVLATQSARLTLALAYANDPNSVLRSTTIGAEG